MFLLRICVTPYLSRNFFRQTCSSAKLKEFVFCFLKIDELRLLISNMYLISLILSYKSINMIEYIKTNLLIQTWRNTAAKLNLLPEQLCDHQSIFKKLDWINKLLRKNAINQLILVTNYFSFFFLNIFLLPMNLPKPFGTSIKSIFSYIFICEFCLHLLIIEFVNIQFSILFLQSQFNTTNIC